MKHPGRWLWLGLLAGLVLAWTGPGPAAQTGQIRVVLEPPEAVEAGAAWSLDRGKTWHLSGETVELEAGTYAVDFRLISGFHRPQARRVDLAAQERVELKAAYVRLPAGLTVNLEPPEAVEAGAAWSLDRGRTWRSSGETVELEPGVYTVDYKLISGFEPPEATELILAAEETAQIEAAYLPLSGRLEVVLEPPEAVEAGAAWSLDQGRTWRPSGEAVELDAGAHQVRFKSLPGWLAPPDGPVTLAARTATIIRGTYRRLPSSGRIQVDLGPPEALREGAAWSADDGRTWRPSGEAVELPAGERTIVFKPLPGWAEPEPTTVNLSPGGRVRVSYLYGAVTGLGRSGWLRVSLGPPEAVEAGAAWSVDAGTNWYRSDQLVRLDPGRYLIMFKELPGFKPPQEMETFVVLGQETREQGVYRRP